MSALEFYLEFLDLVRNLVHKAGLAQYMDEAESYLALLAVDDPERPDCRSRTRRDPTKCKLSTWVGHQIIWHLLTLRTSEQRRAQGLPLHRVHHYYHDRGSLCDLSEGAETIIRMIRYDPEGCRTRFNRANAQEKLRWHMKELGWSDSMIEEIFEELKELIK